MPHCWSSAVVLVALGLRSPAAGQAVLDRANGGVLFTDEAYSLIGGGQWDYGPESVSTLVSHIENKRGSVAVIAAGYSGEMDAFLESNPGLRSRFGTTIEFPDYSPDELVEIFRSSCADQGLECSDDVVVAVRGRLGDGAAAGSRGNARFVRQLAERSIDRMAARAAADGIITPDELRVLSVDDLPPAAEQRVPASEGEAERRRPPR